LAVRLRLRRVGKKKQPYYRIIATESTAPREGRFIEAIGFYDPSATTNEEKVKISKEKYDKWLKNGARPTESLKNLLKKII